MGFCDFLRAKRQPSPPRVPPPLGEADPRFVGDCLAYCFIDRHFNLPEAEINAIVESVPELVRPSVPFWINVYLCWLLRQEVTAKQGAKFFEEAFEAAQARFAL